MNTFRGSRWNVEQRIVDQAHRGKTQATEQDDDLSSSSCSSDSDLRPGAFAVSLANRVGDYVRHPLDHYPDDDSGGEDIVIEMMSDEDTSVVLGDQKKVKPWCKRTSCLLLLLAIAGTAVLGVVFSRSGKPDGPDGADSASHHNDDEGLVTFDVNEECGQDTRGVTLDDPFVQCWCGKEKIAKVSDSVKATYRYLENLPEFREHILYKEMEMTSCDPANIAMVWMAMEASSSMVFSDGKQAVERFILALLYAATNGDSWENQTHWLSSTSVCSWHGVECDVEGHVRSLSLPSNNMQGSLEPRLGLLSALEKLDLADNVLTGTIPMELWSLSAIEEISLSRNDFTGTLPSQLGGHTSTLRHLNLSHNPLNGPLPGLKGLTNLTELYLGSTFFTGSLPTDSLKDLGQLEILDFTLMTALRSTLPTSLSALTSLKSLFLVGTSLSGSIPESIGSLSALEHLTLGSYNMVGTLPTTLGFLTNLSAFSVRYGDFIGSIPSELGQCSELKHLQISAHRLGGTIPSDLARCSNLETLLLVDTQLTGTLPVSLLELDNLREASIYCNSFTKAPFPLELCDQPVVIGTDALESIPACSGWAASRQRCN